MVRQKVVSFDCTFLLLICLKLASPFHFRPVGEYCPNQFLQKIVSILIVFWRKVGIVIVLHLFHDIDCFEVSTRFKIVPLGLRL